MKCRIGLMRGTLQSVDGSALSRIRVIRLHDDVPLCQSQQSITFAVIVRWVYRWSGDSQQEISKDMDKYIILGDIPKGRFHFHLFLHKSEIMFAL
jgi:hypothetical protein